MAEDFACAWADAVRRGGSAKTEIDPDHPLRMLYGADEGRRPLFFAICASKPPLPEVSSDVAVARGHRADGTWTLALTLTNPDLFDVFAALCLDLVRLSRNATTEHRAMQALLAGLARWKDLLRPPRPDHLTPEALRGLVAELWFCFSHLTATNSPERVLAAWRGPLGAPQDVDLGDRLYEVKAVRTNAPDIQVSSAQQLDTLGRNLTLVLVTVDDVPPDTAGATTLPKLAEHVVQALGPAGASRTKFRNLLEAYPVDLADPWYAEQGYLIAGHREYRVTDTFPAIRSSLLPAGIRDVRYRLDTAVIAPFRAGEQPER